MKVIVRVIVLLLLSPTHAQYQWYFGNYVGIDFGNGTAQVTNDGQLQYNEGSSSASDCENNLLFYSDGEKVWNREHVLMPNGLGLSGHYSATQGCLIIQKPDVPDQYFIFTPNAKENGYNDGLTYSIVDLTQENGLGDVIYKNKTLHHSCSEKICATMHGNQKDIWVIWHGMNSDTMYSVLITANGISQHIHAQAIGPVMSDLGGIGQMKASQNGTKIAYVSLEPQIGVVMDFNKHTGVFSDVFVIPGSTFNRSGLYGVEFSPKGNFLYITNHHVDYNTSPGYLYQFDLSSNDPSTIINTAFVIGTSPLTTDMRGLQLAPDGKIYVSNARSAYLGIIHNPDMIGPTSNYQAQGLYLGNTNTTLWGLPSFVTGRKEIPSGSIVAADFTIEYSGCTDEEIILRDTSHGEVISYNWYLNGEWISESTNLNHRIQEPGTHNIALRAGNQCDFDTAFKIVEFHDCSCEKTLFVPSAFSPNGDGENDMLFVRSNEFELTHFRIYDRLGRLVYQSSNADQGWDGTIYGQIAEASAYTYFVAGICLDSGRSIQKHGNVTVFR